MGKVIIKKQEDAGWTPIPGRPEVARRLVLSGENETPEVFLVHRGKSFVGPRHSHSEDEIIYILEGDVTVGNEHCPTGTVLFIQKDTPYGPLRSGPGGVTFLNIRQHKASTQVTNE